MRYFNASDIRSYNRKIILESYDIKKMASSIRKSVFLSHSSKDADKLTSVINFLEQYETNVYIDKEDKDLPRKTSPETAVKLKKNIVQCNKFIVLVSNNSKESKWIPWELGIADVEKRLANIALLPSTNDFGTPDWLEQEYMGLYHRIVYGRHTSYTSPVWMVYNHSNNTGTELGEWLTR